MLTQPNKPVTLLAAQKWLDLAGEVRELADASESPMIRAALHELTLNYTAFAAGLDASSGPDRTGMLQSDGTLRPLLPRLRPAQGHPARPDPGAEHNTGPVTSHAAPTRPPHPLHRILWSTRPTVWPR